MSRRSDLTVEDNEERSRYEATTEAGVVAGFVTYRDRGDVRVLVHTEVDDAFEGVGVGSTLARVVLDDVRRRGLPVRIYCPFLTSYVARHPEYADLVG